MIPAQYAPFVVGFLTSGLMSCIVTCVATVRALGLGGQTFATWMGAWGLAWPIAFAVITVAGPSVRRLVAMFTRID